MVPSREKNRETTARATLVGSLHFDITGKGAWLRGLAVRLVQAQAVWTRSTTLLDPGARVRGSKRSKIGLMLAFKQVVVLVT